MVLFIGFPAAGSSIIGFFLNAHPNIVMTDEAELKTFLQINDRYVELPNWQYKLFNFLLKIDRYRYLSWKISFDKNKLEHNRRGYPREERYVYITGQYQGRFQKLHVIGNKNSARDINILANTSFLKNLRSKLEDNKISLKFILITRDLYDTVASAAQQWYDGSMDEAIESISEVCEWNQKILEQIDSNDVFICRNEDLIANPKLQITRLCDFLKVSTSADYINACASRVVNKPTKSEFKPEWSNQHKEKINSLIKKYDFLSSYDC